jgi:hypothetical protein
MKHKNPKHRPAHRAALPLLTLLVIGVGGLAPALAGHRPGLPAHFRGLLNDYTPSSANGVPIKGAPYEMHGAWKLDLDETRTMARFSTEMTMQTPDFLNADPNFDPGTLGAHSHHITLTSGTVHDGPTDWQTMCPKLSPAAAGGFAITGMANVTANGSNPPFGNPSPVTICILGAVNPNVSGAAYVQFSNFTLTFGAPASSHFGPQAIHGVVARCGPWLGRDPRPCAVTVDR